uniref:PUL domain-containing protein n=1 Tax=Glossina brevipalpis TaxID=37001 RepID=A0A1A9W428_9MUSC
MIVFCVDISDSEPTLKLSYNRGIHLRMLRLLREASIKTLLQAEIVMSRGQLIMSYRHTGIQTHPQELLVIILPVIISTRKCRKRSISTYLTFDVYDCTKVLDRLREFNQKLSSTVEKVTESVLRSLLRLAEYPANADAMVIEGLKLIIIISFFLYFRLTLRSESIFIILESLDFIELFLPRLSILAANQLMIIRCFANMINHKAGRQEIYAFLPTLFNYINGIKAATIIYKSLLPFFT